MTINVFGGGNTGGPAFPLQRSVRLRSSASAFFSRTPASASNRTTWTWSGWIKRGALSSQNIFGAGTVSSDYTVLFFNASNAIQFNILSGNVNRVIATTTAVFRDPSAWYHIVFALDTTQAVNSNGVKLWVNGVEQSFTFTAYTQNQSGLVNFSIAHSIGQLLSTAYLDGYLTEVNFIDGQALTPSSFGSINSTTGVWQPIRYSGTYGTNGFYLNFQDNSAATAAAIGKDSSGNGNNWTPNNISVTAGVTYDSMLDVPTLTSSTNANFCTLNPLLNINSNTISNANLGFSIPSSTTSLIASTMAMSSGNKYYFEIVSTANANQQTIGIASITTNFNSGRIGVTYGYALDTFTGNKLNFGTSSAYGSAIANNDIVMVAYDATSGSLWFGKNGTWFASGNPASGTNSAFTGITGEYIVGISGGGGVTSTGNINFGQRPFTYTPPTGFKSLNTYNLPAPTIPNGATQFAATTYTGVGSSLAISNTVNGKSFQPDLVWVKGRSGATDHALYDSVRGTTKQLESNTTTAETTEATGLTAFGTGGFTVGALAQMNTNTATYVGWQWKASNAAAVTNTSGTISSQVSANPSAGFSIVTYTGTGANATVGHGLGVAPSMVIVKIRTGVVNNWVVYHKNLTSAAFCLLLDTTGAQLSSPATFNSTAPTSTVFSVGTGGTTNTSASTYVAYCFSEIAGYSKFGSYTGNGSTDGPFVYLGFRPRWLLIKRTDSTGNWNLYDSTRNPYNVTDLYFQTNNSNAEASGITFPSAIDFLSNGFKTRNYDATYGPNINANGGTYIYAAFAESPFNYSLAR
jgi:hypothetical protein